MDQFVISQNYRKNMSFHHFTVLQNLLNRNISYKLSFSSQDKPSQKIEPFGKHDLTNVSPVVVYKVSENEIDPECPTNSNGNCTIRHSFHWHSEHVCEANLICTKLEGEKCETFGINFIRERFDNKEEIGKDQVFV